MLDELIALFERHGFDAFKSIPYKFPLKATLIGEK